MYAVPRPLRCVVLALVVAAAATTALASDGGVDGALAVAPDAGTRRPDAGIIVPDAGLRTSDAGIVIPGAGSPRTDAGLAVLDGGPLEPDAGIAAIDAGRRRPPRRTRDAGLVDASIDAPIFLDAPIDAPIDAGVELDAAVDAMPQVTGEVVVVPPSPEELATAIEERTSDAPVTEAAPEGPPASAESTVFALKLVFGLAMLLALAYLGGHPRVLRLQDRLGLRGVILAGFPFVAIGVIASLPSISILTDEIIPKVRPMLQFGLGWIGFIIGAHLDIRVLDRVPRGSAYLILIEAVAPFGITAVGCGAVMFGVFGLSVRDPASWRDILLLGAAAAMTAPRKFHGFANRTWREGRGADVLLGQLDEIVGIVGLLFLMAYFRGDDGSAWQLPGTAWLFVAVGLGVVIGVLIFATIRMPRSNAEFLAIVLGVIAFASGLASVLRLSPVVTCFIAGTLITNFPNEQRDSVFRILNRLERPIHLVFLMIAGALWEISDWRGWVLVPLFVVCRIAGKWLGTVISRFTLRSTLPVEFTQHRSLVLPMSMLAIALVVSIERFRDVGLSWVVTAVIGGAVVFEALVPSHDDDDDVTASGRIDELDDGHDPVYDRDALAPPSSSIGGDPK